MVQYYVWWWARDWTNVRNFSYCHSILFTTFQQRKNCNTRMNHYSGAWEATKQIFPVQLVLICFFNWARPFLVSICKPFCRCVCIVHMMRIPIYSLLRRSKGPINTDPCLDIYGGALSVSFFRASCFFFSFIVSFHSCIFSSSLSHSDCASGSLYLLSSISLSALVRISSGNASSPYFVFFNIFTIGIFSSVVSSASNVSKA